MRRQSIDQPDRNRSIVTDLHLALKSLGMLLRILLRLVQPMQRSVMAFVLIPAALADRVFALCLDLGRDVFLLTEQNGQTNDCCGT
jgi:hypothetical protein